LNAASNKHYLDIARKIDLIRRQEDAARIAKWTKEWMEKNNNMTPEAMRGIRDRLCLSQTELAKRLKVTRQTISNYEKGLKKIPYIFELALKSLTNN
jgi:DNA-binding transcriptional regulator YiaG